MSSAVAYPFGRHGGQCWLCPAHQIPPAGSQSAELETCSARLALYGDACKSNAFGTTVHAGEAVRIEGLSASTAVGADRLVWKWTDAQSHVHRVTNAFTVLSVRLFGDVDLDGDADSDDKALHPALTNDCGWGLPAATNVFRPVRLRTDVGLSGGVYTLSLSGDGGFRVWSDDSGTNAVPLLVCGQTVTNGVNGITFLTGADTDLYVEAVSNSTATLNYAYIGTGDAEGISCAAALKMTAYGLIFVEDTETDYNFSPSLGETGTVKVAVIPAPPVSGIPGHHFKIEIVRETQDSGSQHVDWIDVKGDNAYGRSRRVDIEEMAFEWSGVPVAPFGSSASQALGRDGFAGVTASTNRLLSAVTLNQPVPPPLYTAVASIRRNSDGMVMCEARKRIFVPQVVRITYDADAVTMTKAGYEINNTNGVPVYLISPMSDTEWNTQRARILAIAQANYNAVVANVRFVDANVMISQPYSCLNMEYSLGPLGFAPADFLNVLPSDSGTLCSYLESSVLNYYANNPSMMIPITANEIGNLWGHVVAHECGHLFGLVAPGDVLDGSPEGTEEDTSGWHNQSPAGQYVMNPGGGTDMLMQLIGRTGSWSWKSRNAGYLKFVLHKE